MKELYVKLSVMWNFVSLEKKYCKECGFLWENDIKLLLAKILCDLGILKQLLSQATVQAACFISDVSGWSSMTRAQVWDKAKPSVWYVQAHSSFMVVPDSRPSSQGWKYTASFSRSPWGKLSFLGENKSAPSVKELPVAPKFGDAKCSPRVCFCFSWQLTHPTGYEPFNSNCVPHVPSSSTPWITGWNHRRLLII